MTRPIRTCVAWSLLSSLSLLALAACGDDDDPPDADAGPSGVTRYEVPTMTIAPGETKMYLHWVSEPFAESMNIADLTGTQGPGGHHAILYTTSEIQPVGTTREFGNDDQAGIQFVGGIGGEGGAAVKLPAGVVFRVPAGRALAVQTHYFNPGDTAIEGRSTIDVQLAPPSPTDRVAHFFASAAIGVSVPAHSDPERSTSCVLQADLPLLMYSNHIHELGVSIRTTVTAPDGTTEVLKDDASWDPEWIFNPDYTSASVAAPRLLRAGSTVTTTCRWHNDTGTTWTDPDEMCVFFAFFLGERDVTCADGQWIE